MSSSTISLAAYLPQFHEVEENNLWWGKGFTEWKHLNVAKQWSKNHVIRYPHKSLGQYNLLNPDVLESQFHIAEKYGITGFSVWHYWFGGGDKILERPIELVKKNKLNFKYSLNWANHSWMNKTKGILLKEQQYLGEKDYRNFFYDSLAHFETDNYIKIESSPIFSIYDPKGIPDLERFIDIWQNLAVQSGYPSIYFIGDRLNSNDIEAKYFEKISDGFAFWTTRKKLYWNFVKEKLRTKLGISWSPQIFEYQRMLQGAINMSESEKYMPTVLAGWDTTPRHKDRGVLFKNFNPNAFDYHLRDVEHFFKQVKPKTRVISIKSWNEWAEGNAIEPCEQYECAFLEKYQDFLRRLDSI